MFKRFQVLSGDADNPTVETTRTDRNVAESDVRIFRWLGKGTWIRELL